MQDFGVSCLSLPLFHASVGMEMFGDRVRSGLWARCCGPLTAWCITHQQCLPHAPVPCVARNALGSAAETARPKSTLPEISLQSQALLRPRAGECQQHQGCCKSASWSTDKMWVTTVVGHIIVFCCSWFLGVLDSVPETRVLRKMAAGLFRGTLAKSVAL